MKTHIGIRLSAAIAQNGIFGRALAAATYGGSGFGGGGGAAGAGRPCAAAGPVGGAAGAAAAVVAGVVAAGSPSLAGASPRLVPAAEPERGAPIARALQQVFGDLGHAPPR